MAILTQDSSQYFLPSPSKLAADQACGMYLYPTPWIAMDVFGVERYRPSWTIVQIWGRTPRFIEVHRPDVGILFVGDALVPCEWFGCE